MSAPINVEELNASVSPSSATGAIGGDTFSQWFGGATVNKGLEWWQWLLVGVALVVVYFLMARFL